PEMRAREPLVPRALPVAEAPPETLHDPGPGAASAGRAAHSPMDVDTANETIPELPPLEPVAMPPTLAAADAAQAGSAEVAAPEATIARAASPTAPSLPRERLPELPSAVPPPLVQWPSDADRRVLAVRLVAPQPERFAGRSLRQALAAEGFVLGQFAIFHKPDEERRAVLSAASLTRPGTFDMDTMDSQHYGGLSLFAVLPGPKPPPQAFEELVFTARNLNERLHGVLQDEQGSPLTPARIALLREQLRGGAAS
ncbi:MAG: hypothetical protein JOZ89_00900, partial [Gammaproteobacteria bacterium]|nr:hypothetical protein [Gammaproteobacteria bacterium]